MTSYAGFPGHDEIRAFMEAQQTDVSLSSSTSSPSSATTPNTSSSSADMVPCAPPCSLSGSSENLTPNTDTTMPFKLETPKSHDGGGAGEHQCTICQKRFHHWASLNAHELVHSGKTSRVERCRTRGKKLKSPKTPLTAPPTSPDQISPTLPRPMIPLSPINRLTDSKRRRSRLRRSPPFDVTQTPIPTMSRRQQPRTLVHSSSARPGSVACDQCGKLYSSKTRLRVHQMKRHSRDLHLLVYL